MKTITLISILLLIPYMAMAQTHEAFVAATYTHNGDLHGGDVQTFLSQFRTQNIAGVAGGFSSKVAGPIGLALDLNYSQGGEQVQLMFLGGPEVSARLKKARVFGHAMFGGVRLEHKIDLTFQNVTASLADSSFAYALGGGFERYWGHVGIRTGLDYVYSDAFHGTEHSLRAMGGIAFRW